MAAWPRSAAATTRRGRNQIVLVNAPGLRSFHLESAAQLTPKSRGALNIEGLCATPDQPLVIGFRNPIPQGKALLVPLLNPDEVIGGRPAQLGEPKQLDRNGLGIEPMTTMR